MSSASSSSPYTIPTGEGYVGTHDVRGHGTGINLRTLGYEEDDEFVVVAGDGRRVRLKPAPSADDALDADANAVLHFQTVNKDGYLTIRMGAVDALDVEEGDRIRLYDREDDGLVVVPTHPEDPFVEGGEA